MAATAAGIGTQPTPPSALFDSLFDICYTGVTFFDVEFRLVLTLRFYLFVLLCDLFPTLLCAVWQAVRTTILFF